LERLIEDSLFSGGKLLKMELSLSLETYPPNGSNSVS
jgi:hypothetical protein